MRDLQLARCIVRLTGRGSATILHVSLFSSSHLLSASTYPRSNRPFPTFFVHVTRLAFLVYHRLVEYPWNAFFQREKHGEPIARKGKWSEEGKNRDRGIIDAESIRFFEDKSLSIKNDDVYRGRYTALINVFFFARTDGQAAHG